MRTTYVASRRETLLQKEKCNKQQGVQVESVAARRGSHDGGGGGASASMASGRDSAAGGIGASANIVAKGGKRGSASGALGGTPFAGLGLRDPADRESGTAGARAGSALKSILSKHGVSGGGGGGGVARGGGTDEQPAIAAAAKGPQGPGLTSSVLRGGGGKGKLSLATASGVTSEQHLQLDEVFSVLDLSESHSLPTAHVQALHIH